MNDPFKHFVSAAQSAPHWYVIQCRVGKEPQVAGIINGSLDATAYVPIVRRSGRLGARDVALFPGYLFVCADLYEIRLSSLNATPGVVRLLSVENQPQRIPSQVIETLRQRVAALNAGGGLPVHNFKKGDGVRLKDGPMRGLEAIFLGSTKPSTRVKILLQFLGRLNEVQVEVNNLEPAPNSGHGAQQGQPGREHRRGTRGHGRHINAVATILG